MVNQLYEKKYAKTIKKLYQELKDNINKHNLEVDIDKIEKAFEYSLKVHEDQVRKSGEPYVVHPISVAIIIADIQLDTDSIVAALLHDVVEDTDVKLEEITKLFGEGAANIVSGVTKLGGIKYLKKKDSQAENYRKMFLAMAKDIRIVLVKLADRLHNMRTLKYLPEEKQKSVAQETIDIYSPLAHRLGISKIKDEIEDLSLRYSKPVVYKDLAKKIDKKKHERQKRVDEILNSLENIVTEAGIKNYNLKGRSKHFFSIYRKMVSKNKKLENIYDLFAARVMVETVEDCYKVLGLAHDLYKPMPGRFKDYIAMPKANMYQSLHTTLIGPEGEPFELQIRTYDMHRVAEYGIAAHWRYKGGKGGNSELEEKLTWLRQIIEWQRDIESNDEYMNALKTDLDVFNEYVYIFSPNGDVIDLPKGSTPIDFAYSIHSAVGNKMVGAKVDGEIVTFNYELNTGERVEIITSQNSNGPSRDWLDIVKSNQAKTKIRRWFKKEYKKENIEKGKKLIEDNIKNKKYKMQDLFKEEWIPLIVKNLGFNEIKEVYAAVGHGGLKEGKVVNKLIDKYKEEQKENETIDEILERAKVKSSTKKSKSGILVKGTEDISVRISKCCKPVPGDEIVGFITRGRGVSIHRTDCLNIININAEEKDRLVDANWGLEETKHKYDTSIEVIGEDRHEFLIDVSKKLADMKIPIIKIGGKKISDMQASVKATVSIRNKKEFEIIANNIKRIKGVNSVRRIKN